MYKPSLDHNTLAVFFAIILTCLVVALIAFLSISSSDDALVIMLVPCAVLLTLLCLISIRMNVELTRHKEQARRMSLQGKPANAIIKVDRVKDTRPEAEGHTSANTAFLGTELKVLPPV